MQLADDANTTNADASTTGDDDWSLADIEPTIANLQADAHMPLHLDGGAYEIQEHVLTRIGSNRLDGLTRCTRAGRRHGWRGRGTVGGGRG